MKKHSIIMMAFVAVFSLSARCEDNPAAVAPASQQAPAEQKSNSGNNPPAQNPVPGTKAPIEMNKILQFNPAMLNTQIIQRKDMEIKHLLDDVKDEMSDLKEEINDLKTELKDTDDEEIKADLQAEIERVERRIKAANEKKAFLKDMEAVENSAKKLKDKEKANIYKIEIVENAERYLNAIDERSDIEDELIELSNTIAGIRKDVEDILKNEAASSPSDEKQEQGQQENKGDAEKKDVPSAGSETVPSPAENK